MIRPAGAERFDEVIPLQPPRIETLVIVARHRGRCMRPHGCGGAIRVDEEIRRVDGRWLHDECVPYEAVEAVPDRREAA